MHYTCDNFLLEKARSIKLHVNAFAPIQVGAVTASKAHPAAGMARVHAAAAAVPLGEGCADCVHRAEAPATAEAGGIAYA